MSKYSCDVDAEELQILSVIGKFLFFFCFPAFFDKLLSLSV